MNYPPSKLPNIGTTIFSVMSKMAADHQAIKMILNSPHNPTGSVFSQADIDALCDLVKGTDILLILDDVYEHMVFDGQHHLSFVSYDELYQRSFVISSFGKTYHATGWKVAYCIAPPALTAEFRKVN